MKYKQPSPLLFLLLCEFFVLVQRRYALETIFVTEAIDGDSCTTSQVVADVGALNGTGPEELSNDPLGGIIMGAAEDTAPIFRIMDLGAGGASLTSLRTSERKEQALI